ncbi:hypothetical protein BDQ12DRAFT_353769 [Crucibulum laeve]|uniref:LysM domain-containing protein n=1 Tax=Crucibulum laeve TaxID=68775 RepID=A0A5C3M9J8_9AGAR|nr:hypothetical protein BDQ12DRAFT_353769 [Crucibulum laeve]
MGRWTQYDEDDYRLPEGMKRIGYDSDSGRYYFRNSGGSVWQGPEGAEFGEMTKVSELPTSLSGSSSQRRSEDLEAAPRRAEGYQPLDNDPVNPMARSNAPGFNADYRSLFPFFLIIAVVLLLIWRLILSPGLAPTPKWCPEGAVVYTVQPGDNCWEIARIHGCPFERFKELNQKLQCDHLMPGSSVCLPDTTR